MCLFLWWKERERVREAASSKLQVRKARPEEPASSAHDSQTRKRPDEKLGNMIHGFQIAICGWATPRPGIASPVYNWGHPRWLSHNQSSTIGHSAAPSLPASRTACERLDTWSSSRLPTSSTPFADSTPDLLLDHLQIITLSARREVPVPALASATMIRIFTKDINILACLMPGAGFGATRGPASFSQAFEAPKVTCSPEPDTSCGCKEWDCTTCNS